MGPFDARAIANRILAIAHEQGKQLTVMQLLKLVYLAHGWWLSFSGGQPLTSTEPEAWQYGPVYPEVYREFRRFGRSPITVRAMNTLTGFPYDAELPEQVVGLLDQVVASYGDYHAFTLSNMMHRPGTPWSITYEKDGGYASIPNEIIRQHFDDIRRQRAVG